jgi:hypothetical protein
MDLIKSQTDSALHLIGNGFVQLKIAVRSESGALSHFQKYNPGFNTSVILLAKRTCFMTDPTAMLQKFFIKVPIHE